MKKMLLMTCASLMLIITTSTFAEDSFTGISDSNSDQILDDFANMQKQLVTGEFDDPFFQNSAPAPKINFDPSSFSSSTYPQMKYKKTNENYTFTLVAPGFKRSNLSITLKNNTLIVSGKTEQISSSKSNDVDISEEIAHNFSKTIPLPADSITSEISSKYQEGVLTISVPRNLKVNPDSTSAIPIN